MAMPPPAQKPTDLGVQGSIAPNMMAAILDVFQQVANGAGPRVSIPGAVPNLQRAPNPPNSAPGYTPQHAHYHNDRARLQGMAYARNIEQVKGFARLNLCHYMPNKEKPMVIDVSLTYIHLESKSDALSSGKSFAWISMCHL